MARPKFETELRAQGYAEIVDRHMEANAVNPEHADEFAARLLVLEGMMRITSEGHERTYRPGDTFSLIAGRRHVERSGAEGRALSGRAPLSGGKIGLRNRAILAWRSRDV